MENKIWSENIQGVLNLDLSREMRFRDDRRELFLKVLGLTDGMTIADIGCGPGTITRKLSKWLSMDTKIIGIDRDTNFVNYAREKAGINGNTNISYIQGDALCLPLEESFVDACISHTVVEHVPNREFLLEQRRVCKPGGRVSVMFAVPDKYLRTKPVEIPIQSEKEIALMDKLFEGTDEIDQKYNVGSYWPNPVDLPKLFEELGFKDIEIDAIAIPTAIDDGRNSDEDRINMVLWEMEQQLEGINKGIYLNNNALSGEEIEELMELVKARFEKRADYVRKNMRIWDYTISLTQVVSGKVEK